MKKKGFTLIELLVVIAIIAMLLAILMPALNKVKKIAMRVVCGTNLKGLGTAQTVYANDYDDEYAVQGGKTKPNIGNSFLLWDEVAAIPQWSNSTLTGFNIAVSTSIYLLVREADVSPKSFVCPAGNEKEFDGKNTNNKDITQLWDFGAKPAEAVSYSYHQPYVAADATQTGKTSGQKNKWAATGSRSASFAVMGDKSPFFDAKLSLAAATSANDYLDKAYYLSNAATYAGDYNGIEKWKVGIANAQSHDRDGQNVTYADGHNSYENRSDVGTKNDNIYTPWTITSGGSLAVTPESQWRIGAAALPTTAYPRGSEDSVLVNDGKWQ